MTIELTKKGDFYEAFGESAEFLAKTIGLTLTESSRGLTMAGFPYHQLDSYKAKLEASGATVTFV